MIYIRIWHQKLIPLLPRQQLLGQHRELCALRGKSWGKNHSTVNYVFTHIPERLVAYHWLVMDEMERRGYRPDRIWADVNYRGKILGFQEGWCDEEIVGVWYNLPEDHLIYPEHNNAYLEECLDNLREKGIEIEL